MPPSSGLDGALSHFSERRQCLPRPALELSVFLAASALVVGTAGDTAGALIKVNAPYPVCALLNKRKAGARLIEFGAHFPGRWVTDALEFTLSLEHLFPVSSTAAVHADKLAISFGKIG